MDLEAFNSDSFDAAEWINQSYKSSAEKEKQVFVNSLFSKLDTCLQQLTAANKQTGQTVMNNIPKIIKDTQNLSNEAISLRSSLVDVESQISKVQSNTGKTMEQLERLDSLKTKLLSAKQGLQESDSWGALVSELEDLLERNDINAAAKKLYALQKSLAAQLGLPGQSERSQQVEDFRNRIEAQAAPSIVQSITSGDVSQSRSFVEMFTKMERFDQLTQYYRTVQKTNLQRQWQEAVDTAPETAQFLREFYDILHENYQKQTKWCSSVFGAAGATQPVLVVAELLVSLDPSRETVIAAVLKRSNEKLDILKEVSNANIFFGKALNMAVGDSISREHIKVLSQAIFDYFSSFVGQYAAMEQNNLSVSLVGLTIFNQSAAETVRNLNHANSKVMVFAEEAINRCRDITQNCAIEPLVEIFNGYFKSYLDKYKKTQKQIESSRTQEQDWSLLQICISLIQNIGDLKTHLDELEQKLCSIIIEANQHLEEEPNPLFCYRIAGKREQDNFRRLVTTVKERQSRAFDGPNIFGDILCNFRCDCEEIHDTLLSIIFAPVEKNLKRIEPQNVASSANLPDYSFSPQEYITLVGQYLLTLPQHLEPLLLSPAPTLKVALEYSDERYARSGHSADVLLALIAEECCALYQEEIGRIQTLTNAAAKQLATDIEYLGSVLEELGLSLGSNLQQSATLLRAPAENYLAMSSGCDPRVVTKIRQIRQIASIE